MITSDVYDHSLTPQSSATIVMPSSLLNFLILTTLPQLCFFFFFFNDPATTEISPLSLHDALPISSLLPRRFDWGFMNVRLVWMLYCRVPDRGMSGARTWASSMTSPVRMSRAARSTFSGLAWLAEPRWSPAPHLEGHRCSSAGGRHDWAWATSGAEPSMTARARMAATYRMVSSVRYIERWRDTSTTRRRSSLSSPQRPCQSALRFSRKARTPP